jgi:acyl carrier protein
MLITERVQLVISDALYLDETRLPLEARLCGELGAESIDLLDIAYRLEREFGVKLRTGERRTGRGLSLGGHVTVGSFIEMVESELTAAAGRRRDSGERRNGAERRATLQ